MIINEEVLVKINNTNIEHYKLKYDVKYGDKIYVSSCDLTRSSKIRIKYECDICKNTFESSYDNYYTMINRKSSIDKYDGKSLCKKCTSIKCKQTILNKYGYKSYTETDEYKKIIMDKYGVDNISQLQSVKDKKVKSAIDKYGVSYVFQAKEVKNKIKKTCISKYGVDNPTKNRDIFEKAQSTAFKKIKYDNTDLIYQGSYELNFINYSIKKEISFENGPSLKYIMNNKNRVYHSDFYLPEYNLVVEVKSKYTYNADYEENLLKKEYTIKAGYNFIFLIDKDYTELEKIINKNDK